MTESAALLMVYVPVPDEATGRALAEGAIRQHLAACGNLLPGMISLYEWEGGFEAAGEVLLLLKTRPEKGDALEAYLLEQHPYDCPCVLRLPPVRANAAYADWVRRQTAE